MKICLLLLIICFWNYSYNQIYQAFVFEKNKPMVYDAILQPIAEKSLNFYYQDEFDSSIFYYKKLLELKPDYYQGYYNISLAYAGNKNYDEVLKNLKKYVEYSLDKCDCSYFLNEKFNNIKSTEFHEIKKTCCFSFYEKNKKIKLPQTLLQLNYIVGKEQEFLGNNYINSIEKNKLLKQNFDYFLTFIDTSFFPSKRKIGNGVGLIQLILLHADYYPNIQVSLGNKLMNQSKKGYNKKLSAYLIDRGLYNLKQKQLYGTMLVKDKNGQDILYQYDDLNLLIKRRKKLKFQPYQEYITNKSIIK